MNNIYVFEEAQNAYIDEELLHLSTALSTVSKIIKRFCVLRTCAQTSAPLFSVAGIKSDYRFIVSGNYISFYHVYGKEIYVDRILYARRDYMRILFGDVSTEEADG